MRLSSFTTQSATSTYNPTSSPSPASMSPSLLFNKPETCDCARPRIRSRVCLSPFGAKDCASARNIASHPPFNCNSLKSFFTELSRTLNTLQNNHQETVQSHSATAHSSLIAELDTQKFRVAKSFSSLEIETDHLSTQLADLKAQLQELELQGVDGGEEAKRSEVEDEVLLKLRVYRSLGIEAEREGGEWSRAVVRGKGKEGRGEVQVVNVEKKFSKFFYANYFWQAL